MAQGCVGIIGVGNMGEALLAALIASGQSAGSICFTEKRDERALEIASRYGAVRKSLAEVASDCQTILLVVKPQDLFDTLDQLRAAGSSAGKSYISFVAGKTIASIESRLDGAPSVIRVMPNTPALIGKGMAALSAGTHTSAADTQFALDFLRASGKAIEVPENLQDAVTATSGSGPAYFFAFVEAMVAGAMDLGLSREQATELTVQTIYGSAGMLIESGKDATTLRENVTSPNGTTAAALAHLSESGLSQIVKDGMRAAAERSAELSK